MLDFIKLAVYGAAALVIVGILWAAWQAVDTWCNSACQAAQKERDSAKRELALAREAARQFAEEKERERRNLEERARVAADQARTDVQKAQLEAKNADRERRAALARLNGAVRDLNDIRRLLGSTESTSGSGEPQTTGNSSAVVRDPSNATGSSSAGGSSECQAERVVLTEALIEGRYWYDIARSARDACVAQYNAIRAQYNE